jgi:hypothetical protein
MSVLVLRTVTESDGVIKEFLLVMFRQVTIIIVIRQLVPLFK